MRDPFRPTRTAGIKETDSNRHGQGCGEIRASDNAGGDGRTMAWPLGKQTGSSFQGQTPGYQLTRNTTLRFVLSRSENWVHTKTRPGVSMAALLLTAHMPSGMNRSVTSLGVRPHDGMGFHEKNVDLAHKPSFATRPPRRPCGRITSLANRHRRSEFLPKPYPCKSRLVSHPHPGRSPRISDIPWCLPTRH